jgi:hypothetical protein
VRVVVFGDFRVDGARLPRDGFEHGVGAERVHVCAGVCEGQALRDALEGERGVEGESGGGVSMLMSDV